jgi:hypothetical protein
MDVRLNNIQSHFDVQKSVKNHKSPLLSVAIDWWHDDWVVFEHAQNFQNNDVNATSQID